MTEDEAAGQVAAFLRRLGAVAPPRLPVTCRLREALLTFEYHDGEQALSVLALIYRFRTEPRAAVVEALFAAATAENTGGGHLVLDEGGALLLQRDVAGPIADESFAEEVAALAVAGLVWADDIVARAAEKANRQPDLGREQ